jgi:hypothetical protein
VQNRVFNHKKKSRLVAKQSFMPLEYKLLYATGSTQGESWKI